MSIIQIWQNIIGKENGVSNLEAKREKCNHREDLRSKHSAYSCTIDTRMFKARKKEAMKQNNNQLSWIVPVLLSAILVSWGLS